VLPEHSIQVLETVAADSVGLSRPTVKAPRKGRGQSTEQGLIGCLADLPSNWWTEAPNERGGYQYKTACRVFGRDVEMLLDGCAGSNNVTEEFVTGLINCALKSGVAANDEKFPVVQLERWPLAEVVNGIAKGAPVPLLGGVVFKVTLLVGREVASAKEGPTILVRAKICAAGTSDWHGIILGGRALDCAERKGLGFKPEVHGHVLQTLGISMPRVEDNSALRRDKAYPFVSKVVGMFDDEHLTATTVDSLDSTVGGSPCSSLLVYDGEDDVTLETDDVVWIPVTRVDKESEVVDSSHCEVVLPIVGTVEALPGLWPTGDEMGVVCVTGPGVLRSGDPVAELQVGSASTGICTQCGLLDTCFVP